MLARRESTGHLGFSELGISEKYTHDSDHGEEQHGRAPAVRRNDGGCEPDADDGHHDHRDRTGPPRAPDGGEDAAECDVLRRTHVWTEQEVCEHGEAPDEPPPEGPPPRHDDEG